MNSLLILLYWQALLALFAAYNKVSAAECRDSMCQDITIQFAQDLKKHLSVTGDAQVELIYQHRDMVVDVVVRLMAEPELRLIADNPNSQPTVYLTRNSLSCYQGHSKKSFIRFHPEFNRHDYFSLAANEFYHHQIHDLHSNLNYEISGPKLIPCLDANGELSADKCNDFSNTIAIGIGRLDNIIKTLASTNKAKAQQLEASLKDAAATFSSTKRFFVNETLQQILGTGMTKYESKYTLVGNVPEFPYRFAKLKLFKPNFVQPPIRSACTNSYIAHTEVGYSIYTGKTSLTKILAMLADILDDARSTGAKTDSLEFHTSHNVYYGLHRLQKEVEFVSCVAAYPRQVIDLIFPEIREYHRQYFAEKKAELQTTAIPVMTRAT